MFFSKGKRAQLKTVVTVRAEAEASSWGAGTMIHEHDHSPCRGPFHRARHPGVLTRQDPTESL